MGEVVTHKIDCWAFGCHLVALFFGRPVFIRYCVQVAMDEAQVRQIKHDDRYGANKAGSMLPDSALAFVGQIAALGLPPQMTGNRRGSAWPLAGKVAHLASYGRSPRAAPFLEHSSDADASVPGVRYLSWGSAITTEVMQFFEWNPAERASVKSDFRLPPPHDESMRHCTGQPVDPLPRYRAAGETVAAARDGGTCPEHGAAGGTAAPEPSAAGGTAAGSTICQCSANDGNLRCLLVRNRHRQHGLPTGAGNCCDRRALDGHVFCSECKCMVQDCPNPKRAYKGLFCGRCVPDRSAKEKEHYSPTGSLTKLPKCSLLLQTVMKHSYTLFAARRRDYIFMLEVAGELLAPCPGQQVNWRALMFLFLAGAIKVPQANEHFKRTIAGSSPGGLCAALWSWELAFDAWVSALKFCDEKDWAQTWKRMDGTAGTVAFTTGIITHSRKIGLIESLRQPRAEPKRKVSSC